MEAEPAKARVSQDVVALGGSLFVIPATAEYEWCPGSSKPMRQHDFLQPAIQIPLENRTETVTIPATIPIRASPYPQPGQSQRTLAQHRHLRRRELTRFFADAAPILSDRVLAFRGRTAKSAVWKEQRGWRSAPRRCRWWVQAPARREPAPSGRRFCLRFAPIADIRILPSLSKLERHSGFLRDLMSDRCSASRPERSDLLVALPKTNHGMQGMRRAPLLRAFITPAGVTFSGGYWGSGENVSICQRNPVRLYRPAGADAGNAFHQRSEATFRQSGKREIPFFHYNHRSATCACRRTAAH